MYRVGRRLNVRMYVCMDLSLSSSEYASAEEAHDDDGKLYIYLCTFVKLGSFLVKKG